MSLRILWMISSLCKISPLICSSSIPCLGVQSSVREVIEQMNLSFLGRSFFCFSNVPKNSEAREVQQCLQEQAWHLPHLGSRYTYNDLIRLLLKSGMEMLPSSFLNRSLLSKYWQGSALLDFSNCNKLKCGFSTSLAQANHRIYFITLWLARSLLVLMI